MTNRYYAADDRRARLVRDLFAAIAPQYDFINDLQSFGLHRWWKRQLVKIAKPTPGCRVLDLCCGTGDISLAFAQRGHATLGLDFSPQMLEVADRRSAAEPEVPVQFSRGDAQQLPLAENSFDIVTMGYGLRNLADWKQGLGEMQRVAKRGGRIVVLEFGKPANRLWRTIYFAYLRVLVPMTGLIFCGDPDSHSYILESLLHYPAQRGVEAEMRRIGLKEVRTVNFLGGVMSLNYGVKAD